MNYLDIFSFASICAAQFFRTMAANTSINPPHDTILPLGAGPVGGQSYAPPGVTTLGDIAAVSASASTVSLPSITALWTLVTWSCCAAVSVTGLTHPPQRYTSTQQIQEPIPATLIKVELTNEITAEVASPSEAYTPLPLTTPDSPPPPPPTLSAPLDTIPVADPASIEFALPIEAPTQLVPAPQAAYAAPLPKKDDTPPPPPAPPPAPVAAPAAPAPAPVTPPPPAPPAPAAPHRITYGQGLGRQPAPNYPYQAIRRSQTGTVRVRFTVGTDGHVLQAEPVVPCDWPLLNDSAASTVHHRWRFPPGPERVYEVDIRFELQDSQP
ncbi:MAG: energy transducer TonB [Puniceicoccales bacterium]|jgi:protein TonB|nr:energy transducer TonB [Puniceicoccales bacterium]